MPLLRQTFDLLRFGMVILLGAAVAMSLWPVWNLDTRWIFVVMAGVAGLTVSMCMVRVFSDFALIGFMFSFPLMSFQKWFFPARFPEEERGNIVYSGLLCIGILDLFLIAAYVSWFYRIFVTQELPLPKLNWMDAAVGWLLLAHAVASVGSSAPDLALDADIYLFRYALFYFYISRNLTARFVPWMLGALCLTIVLEAILASVQFGTGKWVGIALDKGAGGSNLNSQYSVPGLEDLHRATGTLYDSHTFGHFMALILPFPFVLSLMPSLRVPLRLLFGIMGGLAVTAIVLSLSRSAWVAVAIATPIGALLIIFLWQERQLIPALAMGLVVLAVALPLTGGFIYDRFANAPSGTLDVRYEQYWLALWIIQHFPVFGHGPGNWFESLRQLDYLWLEDTLPVHNVLLWMTADTGLFGVCAYLSLFFVAAGRLFPVIRKRRDFSARLAMATFIALITTLLDGMTDPTFREPSAFTMFWMLISLAVIIPHLPPDAGQQFMAPLLPTNQPRTKFASPNRKGAFAS